MSAAELSKKKNSQRVVWSASEENILVHLWQEKIGELRGARKNSYIFLEMAAKLQEVGFCGSWTDVRTKIDNLTRRYRQENVKIGATGAASIWQHYYKINNILGPFKLTNMQETIDESTDESQDVVEPDPLHFDYDQSSSSNCSTPQIDNLQAQPKKRKLDWKAEIINLSRERNDIQRQVNEERNQQINEMLIRLDTISSQNAAFQNELLAILREKRVPFYRTLTAMDDSPLDLDKCFQVIKDLVDKAGAIIAMKNETRQEFICKQGDIDLVTETDKEVEQLLMNGIREHFPHHKFIGEEESSAEGAPNKLTDAPTWIIDPVDGTMNFVHAFPHSCISVGLVVNKVTELGIVFNPLLKQRFTARRGQGAFYNDKPIKVSGQKDLSKALITSEFGTTRDPQKMKVVIENFAKMSAKAHGLRVLGSAALNMSMVALGAADANYEFGIHAWDVCAGDLIVREAGGVVIDPAGGQFDMMSRRVLAAATPDLASAIVKTLTQFYPEPRDD